MTRRVGGPGVSCGVLRAGPRISRNTMPEHLIERKTMPASWIELPAFVCVGNFH